VQSQAASVVTIRLGKGTPVQGHSKAPRVVFQSLQETTAHNHRLFSCRLGLGMHSQLLIAGVRCVVQLSLLGYILVPIFNYGHLWLVLAYAAFMVWVSAVEAIGRPTRYYKVGDLGPGGRGGWGAGGWCVQPPWHDLKCLECCPITEQLIAVVVWLNMGAPFFLHHEVIAR
jgi:hypothetical protein